MAQESDFNKNRNEPTAEAICDWHYCVATGRRF
jgi:hypothetical protein